MSTRKIILDCDPGPDDAIAILLALASAELEVLAITTVAGNADLDKVEWNARALVELAGMDTPVYAGCPRALLQPASRATHIFGGSGLGNVRLTSPLRSRQLRHAVDVIRDTVRQCAAGTVTLVATGPLTNLACALVQAPDIGPRLREIVFMGGAIGRGNATPAAEFNMYADPHAAAIVFDAGVPLVMVPLEITRQVRVTESHFRSFSALTNASGLQAAAILRTFPRSSNLGDSDGPLHDPCAVAYLLWPELMSGRKCYVSIETENSPSQGRTRVEGPDDFQYLNAHILDQIDSSEFFWRLVARLETLR